MVEIAIVLVIVGLILSAGITIWRSSIGSAKLSTTKTNLANIKTSVINFAIANGRLPCPDTTIPPNNTGVSNPDPAVCGTNCTCNTCANPPCYVPFQTLQLQLPGGADSYGNVFRYDVSYEPATGSGLTNTTQDTFCGVLFEYMNHATDVGVPRVPCVTNQNDGADNGQIAATGQGYAVAAMAVSQTPIDNVFNATAGLSGKNIAGTPREYEMATRVNGTVYGDLVAELTYGELFNKACNSTNTVLKIFPPTGTTSAQVPSGSGPCLRSGGPIPFAYLPLNGAIYYYATVNDCSGTPTTVINFQTIANIDWNGNKNGEINAGNPPTDH